MKYADFRTHLDWRASDLYAKILNVNHPLNRDVSIVSVEKDGKRDSFEISGLEQIADDEMLKELIQLRMAQAINRAVAA